MYSLKNYDLFYTLMHFSALLLSFEYKQISDHI